MSLTDAEINKLVAERVMGLVPCDGWRAVNLGSAGGPVLMGDACDHAPNTCYPTMVIQSTHGVIGGPAAYCTDVGQALRVWRALRASHRWCCLDIWSDYDYAWRLQLTHAGRDDRHQQVHAHDQGCYVVDALHDQELALGICRIALLALERDSPVDTGRGGVILVQACVPAYPKQEN